MFFRYSVPWTFSFLLLSSAGLIDAFFVGRYVGAMALASLNIVWPVFSVIAGFGIALVAGGSVRCSNYLGSGREDLAAAVYTKIMLATLVLSILVSIICIVFTEDLALFLGADQHLLADSTSYLHTVAYFFPPFLLGFAWPYFLRVDERPALASGCFVITAVVNVMLDYIFIVHADMGVHGAALATGIGYVSALIFLNFAYLNGKKPRKLYFTKQMGSMFEVLQSIWNGISEMINEMSTGIVLIVINITIMGLAGASGVAAFTVINIITWFCLMLCFGFSDSLSPLVSANDACRLSRRVRSLLLSGAGAAFGVGLICFLIMTFYPRELVTLFISEDKKAIDFAVEFMKYSRFMFLFCGLNIIFTAYFTGLLKATESAVVAILRTLLLPILFIWLLPKFLHVTGVAIALPLGEIVTLLVALALLRRLHKQRQKV